MNKKYIEYYMDIAERTAKLSSANRLKVGAVLVKDNDIISYGFNGTLRGYYTNECEYESNGELVTKDIVIHAEMNALIHAARKGISTIGTFLFLTHSPCWNCTKHICQAGIREVFYKTKYRMHDDKMEHFYKHMCVDLYQV